MKKTGKRPVIGLVPLYDEIKESYWMLPGYMKGLEEAGAVPVMIPLTENPEIIGQLLELFDGILLPGGHDVDPALYGEKPTEACGELCTFRDRMERLVLKGALEADKPVLGICRGIQFMNVFMGGTLYQDLPTEHPGSVNHHMTPPYHQPAHETFVEKDSFLYRILGKDRLEVNSYHHQAIKELAPGLKTAASAADGLVEAIWMPDRKFVAAVQWHPEFSCQVNEDSRKLFQAFVEACR